MRQNLWSAAEKPHNNRCFEYLPYASNQIAFIPDAANREIMARKRPLILSDLIIERRFTMAENRTCRWRWYETHNASRGTRLALSFCLLAVAFPDMRVDFGLHTQKHTWQTVRTLLHSSLGGTTEWPVILSPTRTNRRARRIFGGHRDLIA